MRDRSLILSVAPTCKSGLHTDVPSARFFPVHGTTASKREAASGCGWKQACSSTASRALAGAGTFTDGWTLPFDTLVCSTVVCMSACNDRHSGFLDLDEKHRKRGAPESTSAFWLGAPASGRPLTLGVVEPMKRGHNFKARKLPYWTRMETMRVSVSTRSPSDQVRAIGYDTSILQWGPDARVRLERGSRGRPSLPLLIELRAPSPPRAATDRL